MRPNEFTVVVTFMNDSTTECIFSVYSDAQDYYRHRISYSGGKIKRVEVRDIPGGGTRAIWDCTWDAVSQAHGLAS